MDNQEASLSEWRVSYLRDVTAFSSFRAAISYADGLANNELVKQIDPSKKTIDLVTRDSSNQGSFVESEMPRSPYD